MLATSEHRLPFRLRKIGFNTDHIGYVIVAEEVPSAAMKDLLVRVWDCGEHLATALRTFYGGHVLHASAAIGALAIAANPATMRGVEAIAALTNHAATCLSDDTFMEVGMQAHEKEATRKRVRKALRALVVDGFLSLADGRDKVAEIISYSSVGRVVPQGATAAAVPPRAWTTLTADGNKPKAILLPSSHIMRLLATEMVFPQLPAQSRRQQQAPAIQGSL